MSWGLSLCMGLLGSVRVQWGGERVSGALLYTVGFLLMNDIDLCFLSIFC
jgi:hypothetical protein